MAAKTKADAKALSLTEKFPDAVCRTGNLLFDVEGNVLGEVEETEVVVVAEPDGEQKDPAE